MNKKAGKRYRKATTFNVVVNRSAAGFTEKQIQPLLTALDNAHIRRFMHESNSAAEMLHAIKRILPKRPTGIIVCGGDGTVNKIARLLIRRTTALGIYPLGRFNNIYRSLYGEPDLSGAIEHILSGKTKKIDYALAARYFFLGSLSIGLLPEMMMMLSRRKTPRFSISWSRLASRAAAGVEVKPISIKVDAFGFNFSPQTLSVHLLPYSLGLPITPASVENDGKCEIAFDIGPEQAIMSSYIRQVLKKKFIYAEDIRMFRGRKIAMTPMRDRKIMIDGELMDCRLDNLNIEVYTQRIRLLHLQGGKGK